MNKIFIDKIIIWDLASGNNEVYDIKRLIEEGIHLNVTPTSSDDIIIQVESNRLYTNNLLRGFRLKMQDKSIGVLRPVYSEEIEMQTLHIIYGERRSTNRTARDWRLEEGYCLWEHQVRNWKHFWFILGNLNHKFLYNRLTGRGNHYEDEREIVWQEK